MSPDGAPRPPIPGPLGRALARLYGLEIARRNRRSDRGAGVTHLDRPVIGVGNLSAGGTGKTPMVMRVLETLLEAGHRPCVAMRGYKSVGGRSDEAEEYRSRFEGVPVIAQPDRIEGLRALFACDEGREVDVVVLDDAFQHRKIARNLDIVLVDATRDPRADRLLPAGYLREPTSSLGRADAVVITHAEAADDPTVGGIEAAALGINPDLVVGVARHAWSGILDRAGHERPASILEDKVVLPVCAIGNPEPFLHQAAGACGRLLEPIRLPDHDPYGRATVERVAARAREGDADAILTTGKDWTKLEGVEASSWPCPVLRPRLELAFDAGWRDLEGLILRAAGRS